MAPVTLTWGVAPDAQSTRLEMKGPGAPDYTHIIDIPAPGSSYTINPVPAGLYFFRATSLASNSVSPGVVTSVEVPPDVPSNFAAAAN